MCIPDDAKHMGTIYQGAGDNKLTMDSWQSTVSTDDMDVSLSYSLTSEGCIPIGVQAAGNSEEPDEEDTVEFVTNAGWREITLGISDPAVFDPPPNCSPAVGGLEDPLTRYVTLLMD